MPTVHPDYRSKDGTKQLWLNPLTGGTELVPNAMALDARDCEILRERYAKRQTRGGPLVGDFVRFADGTLKRFTHDWDEYGLQVTTDEYPLGGSFYFTVGGSCSYSGGLDAAIKRQDLHWFTEMRDGDVWFFHHDSAGAGRGVYALIPCRVYETDALPR